MAARLGCRNCHGAQGQGGYAPDLAGRQLSTEQFIRSVRKPWGVMPAFVDQQASDQTLADIAAYFASLPRTAAADLGAPRFASLPSSPQGQKYIIESYGCANCHQPELRDPRRVLGGEGADFEAFASKVYTHTTEYTDPVPVMGNFQRSRLPETVLREIWKFVGTDLGLLAPIVANINAGTPSGANTEYTVTVTNQGDKGKGLTAETVTVSLVLPQGAMLVSNTGAGFKGVSKQPITLPAVAGRGGNPGTPAQTIMADVAVWQVPRIAADEKPTFSVTLAGAAVPPVVALHLLHRRSRLVGRREREEALAGREELAEAGVLRDDRPPSGQIARAAVAEPPGARSDVLIARDRELRAGGLDVRPVGRDIARHIERVDVRPVVVC